MDAVVLLLLSANHHDLDLADIERLSVGAPDVGRQVVAGRPAVRGAVVLATCNRYELYLDADDPEVAVRAARAAVARASGTPEHEVARLMRPATGDEAVRHVFEVAAGLDAMVVGEREIAGQVRRALATARTEGTTSTLLEQTLQHATRTSRQVAVATDLARAGRSVVAVALDLAAARAAGHACERAERTWPTDDHPVPAASWAGRRVLLVGTGSYAGASLAALRERGATDVVVWSASGRGPAFAASHGVATAEADLVTALRRADLVVTCRGTGSPVLDAATVAAGVRARRADGAAGPLVLVDLALRPDVDPAAAGLDDVVLVDLPTVRDHAPRATAVEVERARAIVADGIGTFDGTVAERRMDDAVVALRSRVADAVNAELERLPAEGAVSAERAAQALRRLAARLVHEPTVRARAAGREGRTEEHLRALEQVLGVAVAAPDPTLASAEAPPPATVPAEPERAR
ncbi:glutamyl-tRNA reductase [Georgenia yuyongxinii]|uniref:Glutamyl-tRNA reductase n=2 Tax=Georgenia yuyongxinii TaxID=2589797 RepID=A0A5B8C728_9MICO|nr:glutamyl-tRNA reductase [Georgenia yuyongxinii]QDC26248.1 glutamyl-tRNA reductase [Georgenia yuyongxinii]